MAKSIGYIKQTNPDILKVFKRGSEVLDRIQMEFHTMVQARNVDSNGLQPINITCFYEELPLPVVGVQVGEDHRGTGRGANRQVGRAL